MADEWRVPKLQVTDTRPLREVLERQALLDKERLQLEHEIEERRGPEWWTLSPGEIRRVSQEIARSRGDLQQWPELAEMAETTILGRLFFARLETAVPGLKHPLPREVWEREYGELVEERHGGMNALAIHVGRQIGLDMTVF